MPTKKSASSDSQTEIKKTKLNPLNPEIQSFHAMAELKSSAKASPKIKIEKSLESIQTKLPVTSINTAKSECCMGTASCETTSKELIQQHSTPLSNITKPEARKGPKTRIVVRYNVGFDNFLTLRGKGANLNWDKGMHLKNIKHDEWLWETEASFNTCEFKVLINDCHYEIGENHPISCGASIQYTPKF